MVRVDLEGFPVTWPVRQGRGVRWVWLALAALGLVRVGSELVGEVDVVSLVVALGQVVLAVLAYAVARTARVELEPAGYRSRAAWFRGRLVPWSSVDHVRPGSSRWGTEAELRGRVPSAAPVTMRAPVSLHGMSREQAIELQRRLVAARAGAEQSP